MTRTTSESWQDLQLQDLFYAYRKAKVSPYKRWREDGLKAIRSDLKADRKVTMSKKITSATSADHLVVPGSVKA